MPTKTKRVKAKLLSLAFNARRPVRELPKLNDFLLFNVGKAQPWPHVCHVQLIDLLADLKQETAIFMMTVSWIAESKRVKGNILSLSDSTY
jgi:hypothetical protein